MRRLPDWEERLAAFLDPLRIEHFAWGRHDCCTFAAGAVHAMTGDDRMVEFRGRYTTSRGAARALRKFGQGTLAATLTAKLGDPVPPALAHRGDIVMADRSLGIAFGAFALFVGAEGTREGLIRIDRVAWQQAWRVPLTDVHTAVPADG